MTAKDYALRIERVLDAPRDIVFRAWTEQHALKKWFHFNEEWEIVEVQVDLRVGGAYRVGWRAPDGNMWYEFGQYREIVPPERLVHTCSFDFPDFVEGETLVTVELEDLGGHTRLILLQEGYRDPAHRDAHEQGWPGFLDQLEKHLRRTV